VRRKLHNELTELRGNIRVYARVRPNKEGSATAIDLSDQGSISLPYNGVVSSFKMDRVFGPLSSQVLPLTHACLQRALDIAFE
jgi:kinesin family protein C1